MIPKNHGILFRRNFLSGAFNELGPEPTKKIQRTKDSQEILKGFNFIIHQEWSERSLSKYIGIFSLIALFIFFCLNLLASLNFHNVTFTESYVSLLISIFLQLMSDAYLFSKTFEIYHFHPDSQSKIYFPIRLMKCSAIFIWMVSLSILILLILYSNNYFISNPLDSIGLYRVILVLIILILSIFIVYLFGYFEISNASSKILGRYYKIACLSFYGWRHILILPLICAGPLCFLAYLLYFLKNPIRFDVDDPLLRPIFLLIISPFILIYWIYYMTSKSMNFIGEDEIMPILKKPHCLDGLDILVFGLILALPFLYLNPLIFNLLEMCLVIILFIFRVLSKFWNNQKDSIIELT
jgi:hypothetical protein